MAYLKPVALKSFILGQYFTDGVKMTLGVLLPAVVFSFLGDFRTGISISLGAFLVSISDSTGPTEHRRVGMLASCGFVFLSALITGILNFSTLLLAIEIPLFCFIFAMFTVYGVRASSVGAAALLAMAISMDSNKTEAAFWVYALMVLAGGLWYTALSLSIMEIRPYRVAQQALGESILKVAAFLNLKANFYAKQVDIESNFQKLATTQIAVNEHQDNVREMLYKTRVRVGESIKSGQLLLVIFVDTLDIFEQMMSTHYDYKTLRQLYGHHGVLEDMGKAIKMIANELSRLGYALINNEKPRKKQPKEAVLTELRSKIEEMESQGVKCLMLRKILSNIRTISTRVDNIYNYFYEEKLTFISQTREESLSKFVGHQSFSFKIILDNLSLESNVFRHAIRLAVTCLVGFLISLQLSLGNHSYWVVLTILVILRPGFSLTKQRNTERILGTLIGGVTGVLILYLVDDFTVRFVFLVLFMVLAYSFLRIRYILAVVFMTPFIFIVYGFLYPESNFMIARERIIDTLVGSGLAYLASTYFLPSWEYIGFRPLIINVLKANLEYFAQIVSRFEEEKFDEISYRLARRKVYLQSANLSAAFQRMLDEPKSKQKHKQELHQFVVLNHILVSCFSTLSSSLIREDLVLSSHDQVVRIKRARNYLLRALEHWGGNYEGLDFSVLNDESHLLKEADSSETSLLTEQLRLIRKTCSDLERISRNLAD
ncbi:FUSC family protein [Echinicola sp. CAU 1574]|uniref:FUSC family protein n=1 Tax=Echinicola arenosa TaxID=2774144 RepID=A0ABR9AHF1_9BACT|nr:FUSC family membrane protein [Echinicola arenosa]MBD8487959.1 FUSC family protein [Echinicola arenosa]